MAATKKKPVEEKSMSLPNVTIDLNKVLAPSRVYIVEHFVVHIALVLLTVSSIALFNSVIDHLMAEEAAVYSVLSSTFSFEQLAVYIAMAIVALPLFAVFYTRSRKAERAHPELLMARPHRRLIYLVLGIAALFLTGYLVGFVYTTILALISVESVAGSEGWLQSTLKQWFAIGFIGAVAWFISRMTLGIDEEIKK